MAPHIHGVVQNAQDLDPTRSVGFHDSEEQKVPPFAAAARDMQCEIACRDLRA
jgi:hypothetical protein